MSISDETLAAYVAGTLSPRARARVDAALANDPALAERLRRHVTVKGIVQNAYGAVSDEARRTGSDGERRRPAQVVQLAAVREARRPPNRAPSWRPVHIAAIVAALVVGSLVGRFITAPREAALVGLGPNGMVAQGSLAHALSSQLSQAPSINHGGVLIYGTFRAQDGAYCRVFRNFAGRSKDGIACREHNAWSIRMVSTVSPSEAQNPVPQESSLVRQAVAAMSAGPPVSGQQEAQLRDRNWRA